MTESCDTGVYTGQAEEAEAGINCVAVRLQCISGRSIHMICATRIFVDQRVCCSVLQCVAVCCSVLQCVAVRCSALQGAAVRRRVLQSVL